MATMHKRAWREIKELEERESWPSRFMGPTTTTIIPTVDDFGAPCVLPRRLSRRIQSSGRGNRTAVNKMEEGVVNKLESQK